MKKFFLILAVVFVFKTAHGQILNGSFENISGADLSNWGWICSAQSYKSAPASAGNWCIEVEGGNYQGCFPGCAFQKIPSITNGQQFYLSGWAFSQAAAPIGIYFGKIKNGIISKQLGDTTTAASWTYLSIQSSFSLEEGDTALVILSAGNTSGPIFGGYGYFDLINLEQVTAINTTIEQNQTIEIYPNPCTNQAVLQATKQMHNATLTISNCLGQIVAQINNIEGLSVTFNCNNKATGLYLLRLTENNRIIATKKYL